MGMAVEETRRRRKIQEEFNRAHNITPTSIKKAIKNILSSIYEADYYTIPLIAETRAEYIPPKEIPKVVKKLKREMREAAHELDFERAALLRDQIREIQEAELRGDVVKPVLPWDLKG
jgi:excinuclease ABC subunit B